MPVVLEEFGSKLDKRCGRRPLVPPSARVTLRALACPHGSSWLRPNHAIPTCRVLRTVWQRPKHSTARRAGPLKQSAPRAAGPGSSRRRTTRASRPPSAAAPAAASCSGTSRTTCGPAGAAPHALSGPAAFLPAAAACPLWPAALLLAAAPGAGLPRTSSASHRLPCPCSPAGNALLQVGAALGFVPRDSQRAAPCYQRCSSPCAQYECVAAMMRHRFGSSVPSAA